MITFAPAAFACDYPVRFEIPNGSEATKDEMLVGVTAMKTWQEEMIVYRQCIEEENEVSKVAINSSDPLDKEAQIVALDRQLLLKYNASVDDETKLGSNFNDQIRAYNSKKKKKD